MVRHRGKVKIQYIMDRKERKRTLQKRLPGLLKKTGEFAILCNAPTSLVVYPPGADLQELRGGAVLPPLPQQLVQAPEYMPPPQMMAPPPQMMAPPPLLQDDVTGLPTTEELEAVFMNAGMFTAPQASPSFDNTV
jgi:hypothetical protein